MFMDTSVIIEIFRHGRESKRFGEIHSHIHNEPLFISIIQVGEISDWCISNNVDPKDRIQKIREIVNTIPLNEEICIAGSKIKALMRKKRKMKFSLIDGLISASARSINQKLLTMDSDFENMNDVVFLDVQEFINVSS